MHFNSELQPRTCSSIVTTGRISPVGLCLGPVKKGKIQVIQSSSYGTFKNNYYFGSMYSGHKSVC